MFILKKRFQSLKTTFKIGINRVLENIFPGKMAIIYENLIIF